MMRHRLRKRYGHTATGKASWWNVYLRGKRIDSVHYDGSMDADDVKRSLVNHDGYDSEITVRRAPKTKLGSARGPARPSRKDLIAALGLPAEGHTRGSKYAATTQEFWNKIRHGESEAVKEARRQLGIKETS
jgi:hypothetical protein